MNSRIFFEYAENDDLFISGRSKQVCLSESQFICTIPLLSYVNPSVSPYLAHSIQIELGTDYNLYLLIKGAGASQAKLIDIPVNTDDGLLSHDLFI